MWSLFQSTLRMNVQGMLFSMPGLMRLQEKNHALSALFRAVHEAGQHELLIQMLKQVEQHAQERLAAAAEQVDPLLVKAFLARVRQHPDARDICWFGALVQRTAGA